jgi:hypothetical protein
MKKELSLDFPSKCSSLKMKTRLCRPTHMFLNPLTQVGDRRTAFEIPFRGHVSRVSILVSRETAIGSKQRKAVTSIAGGIAIIDRTRKKVNVGKLLFTGTA